MKQSEFVRWLKKQGATFSDAKNHLNVYLNGKKSQVPRHPEKELKKGLVEGVKKQLHLKWRRPRKGLAPQFTALLSIMKKEFL